MARTYVLGAAIALLLVGNIVGGYLITKQHNSLNGAQSPVVFGGD